MARRFARKLMHARTVETLNAVSSDTLAPERVAAPNIAISSGEGSLIELRLTWLERVSRAPAAARVERASSSASKASESLMRRKESAPPHTLPLRCPRNEKLK